MKKTVCLMLVSLMCFALSACGKSDAVISVENTISSIGDVTLSSNETILLADEQYQALEDKEKDKVENVALLKDAQKKYSDLLDNEAEKIKTINTDISAYKANLFDETLDEWYYDSSARTTVTILFQLQGINDGLVDADKMSLSNLYVAKCNTDNTLTMFMKYDDNSIRTIIYDLSNRTAKIGSIITELPIEEYIKLLKDKSIIDEYAKIDTTEYMKVLNTVGQYAS